ncbi:ROK family transcriptional regulator [Plantactinospora sp. S1510]|uniref:ROK family transcriptional regulator n=1 Tax=Plantactinospora alkalitolerans TaxID=2789879 RepID=A0ABS0H683_9ACTN|nr:ROK family transcriptional regulator [Plantactinospora alkalitolerans]MBF9133933.1 ROK family transcriptional regulator [Plantactinospora alkalitolerans]
MRAGPSQEEIRRQNLGALLRYVHIHGATSRAELTTSLGLNRSTIGALTAELAAAGLISERAPRETGRAGRPSLVVRPESARVFAYAYSIEVDRLRAARIGLGGVVLDRRQAERPPGLLAEDSLPLLAGFAKDMHQSVADGSVYVGSGIAVCGPLRRPDGAVHIRPDGDRSGGGEGNKSLGESLGEILPSERPILVSNAADASAVAEHARGAANGFDDVIYLHRDVGIDAGIIVGGRRLTGQGGYAGEVGHMVVHPGGRPCDCGSHGCWETEIGEYAMLRAAGRNDAVGREAALRLIDAAARGDAKAQAAIRQVGDWLGFGVANLVNIFNPGVVIFGGTLRDVYLAAAARVRSRLNSLALPASREQVRLRTPQLGEDAALVGAAELAFEHLLADPLDAG